MEYVVVWSAAVDEQAWISLGSFLVFLVACIILHLHRCIDTTGHKVPAHWNSNGTSERLERDQQVLLYLLTSFLLIFEPLLYTSSQPGASNDEESVSPRRQDVKQSSANLQRSKL